MTMEIWWGGVVHVGWDAQDYEDEKHKMWYITNLNFHKCGIHQQTMAWVLSQNIKVVEITLNEVNPKHNIFHEQIGQKYELVDDMLDPLKNPHP